MKRFVLIIVLVVSVVGAETREAKGQEAKAIVENYCKAENAVHASLDRKTFNLMKPFLGLDKETKRLFKALDFKTIDILSLTPSQAADSAERDLDRLLLDSIYAGIKTKVSDEKSGKETGGVAIYKETDGFVTDFVIYSRHPNDSTLMVLRIECNARLEDIIRDFGKDSSGEAGQNRESSR